VGSKGVRRGNRSGSGGQGGREEIGGGFQRRGGRLEVGGESDKRGPRVRERWEKRGYQFGKEYMGRGLDPCWAGLAASANSFSSFFFTSFFLFFSEILNLL
jgi:hypothetical protein